jgi:hypothetical protein
MATEARTIAITVDPELDVGGRIHGSANRVPDTPVRGR